MCAQVYDLPEQLILHNIQLNSGPSEVESSLRDQSKISSVQCHHFLLHTDSSNKKIFVLLPSSG